MYKITVEDENGGVIVYENVLDYSYIDKDFVQQLAGEILTESPLNKGDTTLTEEEIKEVQTSCRYWEQLPDPNELQGIIQDVINDRY